MLYQRKPSEKESNTNGSWIGTKRNNKKTFPKTDENPSSRCHVALSTQRTPWQEFGFSVGGEKKIMSYRFQPHVATVRLEDTLRFQFDFHLCAYRTTRFGYCWLLGWCRRKKWRTDQLMSVGWPYPRRNAFPASRKRTVLGGDRLPSVSSGGGVSRSLLRAGAVLLFFSRTGAECNRAAERFRFPHGHCLRVKENWRSTIGLNLTKFTASERAMA